MRITSTLPTTSLFLERFSAAFSIYAAPFFLRLDSRLHLNPLPRFPWVDGFSIGSTFILGLLYSLRKSHAIQQTHRSNCIHSSLGSLVDAGIFGDAAMSAKSAVSTTSSGDKKRKSMSPGFYAVKVGHNPGIYYSWSDTLAQVTGYKNAVRKSLARFYSSVIELIS